MPYGGGLGEVFVARLLHRLGMLCARKPWIIIGIAALYLVRECLISALWRWLLSMDNAVPHDLDSIFRFAA